MFCVVSFAVGGFGGWRSEMNFRWCIVPKVLQTSTWMYTWRMGWLCGHFLSGFKGSDNQRFMWLVTLRCISILESTQIVGCFAGKPLGMRSTCGQFVACCCLLLVVVFCWSIGFFLCFNQNLDKKSFAMATSSVRIQICYDQALVCLFFVGRCHRRMHKGERGVQTHIQHSMNCEPCNGASWQAPNIWYNTLRIGKVWFSWPFLSHHCAVLRHTVGAQWGIWVLPRVWQGAGPFSASELF